VRIVVDCLPHSTMGALAVANSGEETRVSVSRSLMRGGMRLILVPPVISWAIFVLPSGL